jgi:PAS domain S-box-containing protein
MHKLLEKQLNRLRKRSPDDSVSLEKLLEVVSDTYVEADEERKRKDRAMKLMSDELLELNHQIRKESEAYVAGIMENMVDGIMTFNEKGEILSFNGQMQRIYGISAEEAIGQQLSILSPPEKGVSRDFKQIYEEQLKGADHNDLIETQGINAQRQVFPIDLSVSKLWTSSGALYVAVVRDISERKRFERELIEAKEKAEQAAIAKTQFLSTMSHEIRTPMNAVIGLTNLLIQEDPRDNQLENLNILKFAGQNLMVLIDDILDFNKIEAGKIEFEKIDFSLHEVFRNLERSHQVKAEEKGIVLEARFDEKIPKMVVGDPVRLTQILNNLLGNAVKFTEEGKVEFGVRVQEEKENEYVLDFEVSDTGIGIPADMREQIFESFTQTNSSITRQYGGTGLGLAITRRLLELHDTEIALESKLGEGSRFSFRLRYPKSEKGSKNGQVAPESKSVVSHRFSNRRVLLVEDHKVNQIVASRFLQKWGLEVEIAENGLIALEKIQQQNFDLVLMDLQMPEMDGYTASRSIRNLKDPFFQQIPILALSASVIGTDHSKVEQAGMNGFISKPFQPDELNQTISDYLGAGFQD